MRLIDAPGYRIHILVRYKQYAVRFTILPPKRRSERNLQRLARLFRAAEREAREALQAPKRELPLREDCDSVITLGSCGLPLPDGVTEVWL